MQIADYLGRPRPYISLPQYTRNRESIDEMGMKESIAVVTEIQGTADTTQPRDLKIGTSFLVGLELQRGFLATSMNPPRVNASLSMTPRMWHDLGPMTIAPSTMSQIEPKLECLNLASPVTAKCRPTMNAPANVTGTDETGIRKSVFTFRLVLLLPLAVLPPVQRLRMVPQKC
jgi:hypothetical protein